MNKILRRYGDEFLKFHGPSVRQDWRQVTTLSRLTDDMPRVRTATPLRVEADSERIWYEWLGKLPLLMTLHGDALNDAVWRVGKALAGIHEASTQMPRETDDEPAVEFPLEMFAVDRTVARDIDARIPVGFFHGDCWHGNVLIDADEDLVLIDPIQSPWLFGDKRFDVASGVVDLATMHMSFLVSVKLMELVNLDVSRRLAIGDLLLDSYLTEFDASALTGHVKKLSRSIATKYISTYPVRINTMVGWIKLWLSKRVIADAALKGYV